MARNFYAILVLAVPGWAQAPPPAKSPEEVKPRPLTAVERQLLSVERQRQTIREHYPEPFVGNGPVVAAPPSVNCPPVPADAVKPIVDREASRHSIDSLLVEGVVETDPFAPSQNITGGTPPIPETQEYVRKILGKISQPQPVIE